MRNTGPHHRSRKLHPLFGAEISGIDITRPLSPREFGPIRAAFEEHSVLLFRDQPMDDEKQIQFRAVRPARDHRQRQPRRRHQVRPPVESRHPDRRADPARRHADDLPEGQLLLALRLVVQAHALAVLDPDGARLPAGGRQHRVPVHARGVGRAAAGAAGDDPAAGRRACTRPFAQPRAEGHPQRQGADRAAAGQAAAVSRQSDQRPARALCRRPCRPHRRLARADRQGDPVRADAARRAAGIPAVAMPGAKATSSCGTIAPSCIAPPTTTR